MKAIQVTFDEGLLKRLDSSEEVKRLGRSAVMRRAVIEYLRRRRTTRIAEEYKRAYGGAKRVDADLEGWGEEGEWPAE